jgi:aminoglycoside 6'-N-acetyltransferase
MVPGSYSFRPMAAADLPTIRHWLATPHVSEWWGDPLEQFALVSGDLHHPSMQQFIVVIGDRSFAYLQCYDPAAWPNHGFGPIAVDARGIDQFIGEPDFIGQGHGSRFIRAFVDTLLHAGTPLVLTDPSPTNTRAIRAYEKAGFQKHGPVQTPDGCAVLMVRNA